jgi:hypothetical protein
MIEVLTAHGNDFTFKEIDMITIRRSNGWNISSKISFKWYNAPDRVECSK